MLRHRVDADDDMRTPFLKSVATESDTPTLKEIPRLRPKPVHRPEEVLHPTLFVAEHPIVNAHESIRDVMRFFDCFDYSYGDRLPLPKTLHPFRQRRSSGPVSATGIG
jgi:hypothetical protein